MNRQSQWLFEAPFVLERERYTSPYSNPEYYSSSEWETKEETSKQKLCKQIWTVWGFKKSSATLLGYQKQHIKDISKRILGLIKSDLKGKNKNASVEVQISLEGHVDRKTEPNNGNLDMDRAGEVAYELDKQLLGLLGKFVHALVEYNYSQAGSTRPYSSDSQKNRRVVVCVRWEIKSP